MVIGISNKVFIYIPTLSQVFFILTSDCVKYIIASSSYISESSLPKPKTLILSSSCPGSEVSIKVYSSPTLKGSTHSHVNVWISFFFSAYIAASWWATTFVSVVKANTTILANIIELHIVTAKTFPTILFTCCFLLQKFQNLFVIQTTFCYIK